MALRPLGLAYPPAVEDPNLQHWMQQVHDAIQGLPLSYFSTSDGPESSVSAPIGTLGIEIGSSTTKLWIKETGLGSTGWAEVDRT
jgi:hypothetical protein